MTMIELLVSLTIGGFLVAGAATVFVSSRDTRAVNETLSRIQENARFAIETIEQDLRHASFFGQINEAAFIDGRASPLEPVDFVVAGDCDVNFTVNLNRSVDGNNNAYGLGCAVGAGAGAAQAASDVLVVRRASVPVTAPAAGTMQIHSDRLRGEIFNDGIMPAGFTPSAETHDLIVNTYYVSTQSTLGNVPALRRKRLQAGPAIVDEEVIPGVEDLQVQFGVDTSLPATAGRGSVNRYVSPGHPILDPADAAFIPDAQVLAVRVSLLIRAERVEPDFVNDAQFIYADRTFGPANDGFRRALVSKTILLRNRRSGI